MDTTNPLSEIGKPNAIPASYGEDLFWQRQRGEIEEVVYQTLSAAWVDQNVREYPPVVYRPMTDSLRSYVEGRCADKTQYDYVGAKRLGEWVDSVVRCHQENDQNLKLFRHCDEVLSKVSLPRENITRAIKALGYHRFPDQDFKKGIWAKNLDASARAMKIQR